MLLLFGDYTFFKYRRNLYANWNKVFKGVEFSYSFGAVLRLTMCLIFLSNQGHGRGECFGSRGIPEV